MEKNVLLGVDGGNTKTDLFLFDTEGTFLGHQRKGPCCDFSVPDRYAYTQNLLAEGIDRLCQEAGIRREYIGSAVFGLAGVDIRKEHDMTLRATEALLPGRTMVCNDSMMGVLAAAPGGVGVCNTCGTWTSVSGRDAQGRTLQVSGIGPISSESGGGGFVAQEALRYVYSARYRDGAPTALTRGVLDILHLEPDADLHEQFHYSNLRMDTTCVLQLSKLVFRCAEEGDWAAQEILHTMAHTLAESTAGCIKGLEWEGCVTVVLSGSIWSKAGYPPMKEIFMEDVAGRVPCACVFTVLQEAPALGAILQAYRNLKKEEVPATIREKIAAAMIV